MRVFTQNLLAVLSDLAHTAGKDPDLPGLSAIELHTGRGEYGDDAGRTDLLCGASTDRFTAGHTYVPCDGQLHRGPILIPAHDATAIVSVFKTAAKDKNHAVEIHHDGGTLRISEDPNLIDAGLSLRVSLHPIDEFPLGVYRLLAREQRINVPRQAGPDAPMRDVPAVRRTDLEGAVLEPFVKVAKRRKRQLRVYRTHQHEALMVQIGDSYRGMLVPVRQDPDAPAAGDQYRPDAPVHAPELPDPDGDLSAAGEAADGDEDDAQTDLLAGAQA